MKNAVLSGLGIKMASFCVLALSIRAEARVSAIYEVPTQDPSLAKAAVFVSHSRQNNYGSPDASGKLTFWLPEELTGWAQEFTIDRKPDGTWSGPGVDASCARTDEDWFSCKVAFSDLQIDPLTRDAALANRFGQDPQELTNRTLIARSFEGQPIGIIRVKIRGDEGKYEDPSDDENDTSKRECRRGPRADQKNY